MHAHIQQQICQLIDADSITDIELIQSLWSGYGELCRVHYLSGNQQGSVIVKHIKLPQAEQAKHPRGWQGELGHQRKIRSYQVEQYWYQHYVARHKPVGVPQVIAAIELGESEQLLIMQDLTLLGFKVVDDASDAQIKQTLHWLAGFHAQFVHVEPEGLWPVGCYWHLATRPEELARLNDGKLKDAAGDIDAALSNAKFKTLVHGDAKLANFLFTNERAAAVDFQYVGGGCGMKDVAYFLGSCLYEDELAEQAEHYVQFYLTELKAQLQLVGMLNPEQIDAMICEYQSLFSWAWADFHRFLKGWSPGHWKINDFSEQQCQKVLALIEQINAQGQA